MSVLSSSHSALSQETHSTGAISGSTMPSPHEESISESLSSKPAMETHLGLSEFPEEGENPMKNPFTIPPDLDVFLIRDKERKKAKEEREKMKTMKIHEKMTYSTKVKAKQKGFRKALQKEEEEENSKQATDEEKLKALQECLSWKIAIKKDYPLEKETFRNYINDRREIFLLEYAMAVKREEIQRLENITEKEEKKLEKAEHRLEKDIATFDEFLKENHRNSVHALKIAEKESAAKTKKITEIQMINSQINSLQSEISRFENTLQEYKIYKDFLYQLSPKEWQEEHVKKHTKQSNTASKANQESASPLTAEEEGYTDASSSLLSAESLNLKLLCEIRPQLKSLLKPFSTKKSSREEQESKPCSDEEDEEPELYFTDPQQLLSIFTEMEEENLSFIQNSQEMEESLDELQNTFITTHQRTEQEIGQLKQDVVNLKSTIAKEEERAADLKHRVQVFSSEEHNTDVQDKTLTSLNKKVQEVYNQCIGDNEANLTTLQMLAAIEKRLNNLLDNLERVPPEKIAQIEKAKEKERRIRFREEKLKQQKKLQEERLQRALERAQATVIKKPGKKLMFRSSPPTKKEKKKRSQEQMDKEKEELLYYFT
ncbi:cilia- and flagella-associated protein 100 [Anas platyrhynchos]|uniref:Cilia and flagella associated protein 100 n=1 Tax=Anas zonorhyncha TaxID=75864 RepID=A0A8B9ZQ32_9AVES|nr:cilia- and flagella-associated protein 100 [Anas platyrhynchos]XP_038041814.1 cilia- and flagella-associated protein 100 [Anas platyrhynchos]XP_038041815.1 cilia- and flagella-associated protein 100 [Anas platyrhynchos]